MGTLVVGSRRRFSRDAVDSALVKPFSDVEALAGDGGDGYVAGRAFLYARLGGTLFAQFLFGRPEASDVAALCRAYALEVAPGAPAHLSLVEASRVEHVDAAGLELIAAFLREHQSRLREVVTRQAVVRAPGLAGMVMAGFYEVVGAAYPVGVFETRAAALDWLGVPEAGAPLAALESAFLAEDTVLRELRRLLDRPDSPRELELAARRLGTSARTLQRRLAEAGASFRGELMAARIRAAQERLRATDDKLTAVALDLGYGSLQQFSAAFTHVVGLPPSEWRNRHRR